MKVINYLILTAIIFSTATYSAANKINQSQKLTGNKIQKSAPDMLIRDLYQTHQKDNDAILQSKNRRVLDKYFDKNLADLIWKDLTTHQNEVGVIDFDLFYNAQDFEIKKLVVGAAKISGNRAIVPVTFENFKKKTAITYALTKENSAWKISDIKYGGAKENLLGYFAQDKTNESPNTATTGEFEGIYKIGTTTCTVKPIKMAFEVKWKQGAGTEIFFSQGAANDKYIFASDPKTGKANVFSFDDENYNTGIFYRADGKEFKIERVK